MTRKEQRFIREQAGDKSMTRQCSIVLVETPDGYMLARAESPYETAYCASRTASKAIGRAASAAVYGDFTSCEAWETPEQAIKYARSTPIDYH